MTSHSLVPKAAAAAGIDYQELCWRVLETSLPPADADAANSPFPLRDSRPARGAP